MNQTTQLCITPHDLHDSVIQGAFDINIKGHTHLHPRSYRLRAFRPVVDKTLTKASLKQFDRNRVALNHLTTRLDEFWTSDSVGLDCTASGCSEQAQAIAIDDRPTQLCAISAEVALRLLASGWPKVPKFRSQSPVDSLERSDLMLPIEKFWLSPTGRLTILERPDWQSGSVASRRVASDHSKHVFVLFITTIGTATSHPSFPCVCIL